MVLTRATPYRYRPHRNLYTGLDQTIESDHGPSRYHCCLSIYADNLWRSTGQVDILRLMV